MLHMAQQGTPMYSTELAFSLHVEGNSVLPKLCSQIKCYLFLLWWWYTEYLVPLVDNFTIAFGAGAQWLQDLMLPVKQMSTALSMTQLILFNKILTHGNLIWHNIRCKCTLKSLLWSLLINYLLALTFIRFRGWLRLQVQLFTGGARKIKVSWNTVQHFLDVIIVTCDQLQPGWIFGLGRIRSHAFVYRIWFFIIAQDVLQQFEHRCPQLQALLSKIMEHYVLRVLQSL